MSEPTRQRIEAEAERIGYIPNEMARRLQKGRADAIGFVIPGGPGAFDDSYFLKIINGAWSRLEEYDLDLLVLSAPEGPNEMKIYRRLVEGRRVDGLIVTRVRPEDQRIEYLLKSHFPFVAIGGGLTGADNRVVGVDVDIRSVMADVLKRLVDLGHRHIACGGPIDVNYSRVRFKLFREIALSMGVHPTEVVDEPTVEGGERIVHRLLDEHPHVTAFISNGDRIGAGGVRALRARGLTPGRDFSIISLGDSPLTALAEPPVTAVTLPIEELAAFAVDALLKLREGIPLGVVPSWSGNLNLRATDGPAVTRRIAASH